MYILERKLKVVDDGTSNLFPRFMSKLNSTYFKVVNKQLQASHSRKQSQSISFTKENIKLNTQPKIYNILRTEPQNFFINMNQNNQQQQQKELAQKCEDNIMFSARSNQQEEPNQIIRMPTSITQKIFQKELEELRIKEQENGQQKELNKSYSESAVQQCLICFENEPNAVNLNCGHGGICYDCAIEIMQKTKECYLCRSEIAQVIKLDLKSKNNLNEIAVLQSARLETTNQDD